MSARAVLVLVLALGCGGDERDAARRTAIAHRGQVSERVVLTGVLHPVSALELVTPTTDQGMLAIRWMIDDGAVVHAGDRVIAFDPSPFTGKLEAGRAQLREAERQVQLAHDANALRIADKELAVRGARIARDKARLQAELPPELLTAQAAHANQLALTQAGSQLGRVESELAALIAETAFDEQIRQIDLERTRRAIDAAQRGLASLVVTAPRAGVVVIGDNRWTGHKFRVGDLVREGLAVASLPDLGQPMEVRAELIDVDDGRVALHAAGACMLDAFPTDRLACTVEALAPVARGTEARDTLRRTFGVTLALAHTDPARLRPGMAVKIELLREPRAGVVVLRGAVLRDASGARIRLATGALREVALAGCDAQHCAIASGLADGESIATGGGS